MDAQVIVVTGAAGFLGSAVTVDLASRHAVVAIDRRPPNASLLAAAPAAEWRQIDIASQGDLNDVFRETRQRLGRVDFVIHLAAFYHFGTDWHPEYQRTNLHGTANVLRCATESEACRFIFASSLVAMLPPPPGEMLNENSPTADFTPYGKSKARGEQLVRQAAEHLPSVVLRIGGVFSDWCELPPLTSLIKLWGGNSPLRRLVVGKGNTGFPYLHREDFVRLMRCCLDRHQEFGAHEVFLACPQGAVVHNDLFPLIHETLGNRNRKPVEPIFVPPAVAKFGLALQLAAGFLVGKPPYERLWMLDYVDRPWNADTTHTRDKLGWDCRPGMGICERLPILLERFAKDRAQWEHRNRVRNEGLYAY